MACNILAHVLHEIVKAQVYPYHLHGGIVKGTSTFFSYKLWNLDLSMTPPPPLPPPEFPISCVGGV